MPRPAPPFLAAALVASAVLAAGCSQPPPGPGPPPGEGERVRMVNLTYEPAVLRVAPGTLVTWVNDDPVEHTVTPDGTQPWGTGGSGDAYEDWLKAGEHWSFRFTQPGNYTYHCIPHAMWDEARGWRGMAGAVVVEPAPAA